MHVLANYLHHFDPYIFRFHGIGPRYYGVAYLLGFYFAYLLMRKLARVGMLRLAPERVPDLVLNACIFGVLIGGRLGFVLFYDLPAWFHRSPPVSVDGMPPIPNPPPLLWDFSTHFPFWGALRVWDGGMAAHGGVLFSILALIVLSWKYLGHPTSRQIATLVSGVFLWGAVGWGVGYITSHDAGLAVGFAMGLSVAWMVFYSGRHKIPVVNVGDAACMVVPIGLFFGRIANFINGELYGHPSTVPWAVRFPSEIYAPTNGDPTLDPSTLAHIKDQIADFIFQHPEKLTRGEVETFLMDPKHDSLRESLGQMFGKLNLDAANQLTMVKQSVAQSIGNNPDTIQTWNIGAWWQGGHTALTDAMATIFNTYLPTRHPSQLYEALLEGALLFLICWTIGWYWRKDGMASGAFLTLYPVMRIIGEQFRIGDTALNGSIGAGILYSLPMFLGGAIYWGYFIRKSKPRVWQPQAEAAAEPSEAARQGDKEKKRQGER